MFVRTKLQVSQLKFAHMAAIIPSPRSLTLLKALCGKGCTDAARRDVCWNPCRSGPLVLYQIKGRVSREKQKVCQTAYQHVPAEVPGKSDSLWITAVYLFMLLTLEKGTNNRRLVGTSGHSGRKKHLEKEVICERAVAADQKPLSWIQRATF